MFTKDFFQKLIFRDYPILQQFITTAIQVSSDEANRKQNPAPWQAELADAIPTEASYTAELKRTLLSILFLYILQINTSPETNKEVIYFIREHKSDLEENDLEEIKALAAFPLDFNNKECQLFILDTIFSDIGKINQVRQHFSNHGLVSQDQDIAHDYILSLDTKLLEQHFNLNPEQVKHLQKHQFPLHLGHAVQGECSTKKFAIAHQFLMKINNEEQRKRLIDYVILKQIIDVAGARAQLGSILLNKVILNAYLKLKETLYKLAEPNANPYQIYWEFIADFLRLDKAKSIAAIFDITHAYSENTQITQQGFTWRLILQLRIHLQSDQDKAKKEILMVENLVTERLEKDEKFIKSFAKIKAYEEKAKYDFTYCPAIFSTLKLTSEKNPLLMKNIANTPLEFAALVGVKIVALACQIYLQLAKHDIALLESPLNFNRLNSMLQQNPQFALELYNGTRNLFITAHGEALIRTKNTYKYFKQIHTVKYEEAKKNIVGNIQVNRMYKAHTSYIRHIQMCMLTQKKKLPSFEDLGNEAHTDLTQRLRNKMH